MSVSFQDREHYFYVNRFKIIFFLHSFIFLHVCLTNQFPEIVLTAYHYAIMQTKNFLKIALESTGLYPHISLAVDKSTPHRDMNHGAYASKRKVVVAVKTLFTHANSVN